MHDWDDLRIFLAVARAGSVRAAALASASSRSTVLRRIGALERRLSARLFERLPEGYFLTPAGEELLGHAAAMEGQALAAVRRVDGRDAALGGRLRVSLPPPLASHVLMPVLAAFRAAHPAISLEVLPSFESPDLARREAEVDIRIVDEPPESLVGRRVGQVARAVYAGAAHMRRDDAGRMQPPPGRIGWVPPTRPQAAPDADGSEAGRLVITDPYVTVAALRAGAGVSILPCFMGDREPGLVQVPMPGLPRLTDLWVLTHPDLRRTARVRAFTEEVAVFLRSQRALLEGRLGTTPDNL